MILNTLWPMKDDTFGYIVLATMVFCRCGLGLGEMLTAEELHYHQLVQLMAPLFGLAAGQVCKHSCSATIIPILALASRLLPPSLL